MNPKRTISIHSFFAALILGSLALLHLDAFAHGEKEKEADEPSPPALNYIKEKGVNGRDGYNYKHVAKEPYVAPKTVPKEPYKPAVKEEKKEEKGEKKEEKKEVKKEEKKEDKKEEGKKEEGKKEGKKEEKKSEKKSEGKHGEGEKEPPKPTKSTLFDPSMIKLDSTNHPFTKLQRSTDVADYYMCKDTVNDGFRQQVLAEMNTFADQMELPRAQEIPCMVKVAKPNTKFPNAVFIEFYTNEEAAIRCMKYANCGSTRLVMLYPKDKTGIKSKEIYRSYVITDDKKYRRGSFCVSPNGQMLAERNCYVALNPDWLFN